MLERARALQDELTRLRRDIHAHPELGFQEQRTAALVADTLAEIGGIRVRTGVGRTGVVGDLGDDSGPTIAIRADMDALPIDEEVDAPYRSTNPGVMHACGHDAHTAMLLGAAHLLRERFAAERLRGRVRFLFQPSEEQWDKADGKSGASRMIDDGALQGVDAVIALHVDSHSPVGTVGVRSGYVSAAVDTFQGWILGTGGHGAYPHAGTDPTFMAIPVLTALHGIRARRLHPMAPGVVSVGVLRAGNAPNVIPSEVYVSGTIRTFSEEVRAQIREELEKAFALARGLGGDYRLEIDRGYDAGYNDERVTGWMDGVAQDLLGADKIMRDKQGMAGEDFAYMCKAAPGAMIGLGASLDDGVNRGHHTPLFDIDERCLPIGAALVAEAALRFLRGELRGE
jgi:amidohydrolase